MKARTFAARADRASLIGMGAGIALMCLVTAPWAFRAGFFLVLAATVTQIVFSHLAAPEEVP